MMKLAIYPGTFDPLTYGHLDLIERAAELFRTVILAIVMKPTAKDNLFTLEERLEMARDTVKDLRNVQVMPFDGLLINFARHKGANVLIRGLRAYSDFEYEFQMALTNRKLAPEIETLFMMPKENHSYISSSVVKEIARLGGDIRGFVPPTVQRALRQRFGVAASVTRRGRKRR